MQVNTPASRRTQLRSNGRRKPGRRDGWVTFDAKKHWMSMSGAAAALQLFSSCDLPAAAASSASPPSEPLTLALLPSSALIDQEPPRAILVALLRSAPRRTSYITLRCNAKADEVVSTPYHLYLVSFLLSCWLSDSTIFPRSRQHQRP